MININHSRACLFIILILFAFNNVNAVNKITIATIGTSPPSVEKNMEPQKIVDRMIGFWRFELNKVIPYKPDLIVLTEVCDRPNGLTPKEEDIYYKVRENQVLDYFASIAKTNHCYIAFGMRRAEKDSSWRNSCVILDRTGKIAGIYDKNFPTTNEMETGIKPGSETPVIQCDFGRVACAICFDLNFEEVRRKYETSKPDIIIFPSMYHGGLVQSYWAYSCRSFFVGSVSGRNVPSEIRNPLGEVVATSTNYTPFAVATVNLDCRLVHLDYNMDKLKALKEKYNEEVTITDPGKLGAVMITSEHNSITVNQMIKEFGIELLDDYFTRSREKRLKQLGRK